jgi:DNA invertase Pin-like site-specific DNA recombinase
MAVTDHGLEQDFNSLEAQHDAAQAYIRSQAHAGWILIRSRFDDGGYSGGSTERPALGGGTKRLRCAIYTRVSTEHGLEQDFNSLDNQREAAVAYIKRPRRAGA